LLARLLEAHYSGAVPLDLMKIEMDRITRERANLEAQLRLTETSICEFGTHLERLLNVAGDCKAHYLGAPPKIRRQINQGLFVRLFVGQDGNVERAEFTEPFATLLTATPGSPLEASQNAPVQSGDPTTDNGTSDRSRPSSVVLATFGDAGNANAPRTDRSERGSDENTLVGRRGLEPRTYGIESAHYAAVMAGWRSGVAPASKPLCWRQSVRGTS
jgi:site-specific DNA recombinase